MMQHNLHTAKSVRPRGARGTHLLVACICYAASSDYLLAACSVCPEKETGGLGGGGMGAEVRVRNM